jgi:Na+/proline symporter
MMYVQGGLAAVVWTDAIQMLFVLIGLVTLIVKGAIDAGGFTRAWHIAQDGGRLNFFKYVQILYARLFAN